jgi:hypothetical protein
MKGQFDSDKGLHMQTYYASILPYEDCDFLNECKIAHIITPKSEFGHWYDCPTGAIIVAPGDTVAFKVDNREDELILKLKFGERLVSVIDK